MDKIPTEQSFASANRSYSDMESVRFGHSQNFQIFIRQSHTFYCKHTHIQAVNKRTKFFSSLPIFCCVNFF